MFHSIQVRLAFDDHKESLGLHALTDHGPDWVLLEDRDPKAEDPLPPLTFHVPDSGRLAFILERPNLTMAYDDRPLVAANLRHRLLGFAAGPPELDEFLAFVTVLDNAAGRCFGSTFGRAEAQHWLKTKESPPVNMAFWLLNVGDVLTRPPSASPSEAAS